MNDLQYITFDHSNSTHLWIIDEDGILTKKVCIA